MKISNVFLRVLLGLTIFIESANIAQANNINIALSGQVRVQFLHANRSASYIFICSDIKTIHKMSLERFFIKNFTHQKPEIIDGHKNINNTEGRKLVLFAARKQPSTFVLKCLSQFSLINPQKHERALSLTKQIGEKPFWADDVPIAKTFSPVTTASTYSESGNWKVVYMFSLQNETAFYKEFYSMAFGFPSQYCNNNPKCE